MREVGKKLIDILRDPVWQGIGVIGGAFVAILTYIVRRPTIRTKLGAIVSTLILITRGWLFHAIKSKAFYIGLFLIIITVALSFFIYRASIYIATFYRGTPDELVDRSAISSTILGIFFGIVWGIAATKYVWPVFARAIGRASDNGSEPE